MDRVFDGVFGFLFEAGFEPRPSPHAPNLSLLPAFLDVLIIYEPQ